MTDPLDRMKKVGGNRRPGLTLDRLHLYVNANGPCWEWLGGTFQTTGYGKTTAREGRSRLAHRHIYQLLVGDPGGLDLDHLCMNRICCNPDHLEPVTHAENVRRHWQARKVECVHGHAYTPENTYRTPG